MNQTFTSEDIINIINCDRLQNGVPPLVENKQLDQAAQAHLVDMQKYNYYDHVNPITHESPLQFQLNSGFNPGFLAENLAGDTTLQGINTKWMNSPEHKANILNPVYKYTGVAVGRIPMYPENFTGIQEFAAVKGDYTTPTVTPILTDKCKVLLTSASTNTISSENASTIGSYIYIIGLLLILVALIIVLRKWFIVRAVRIIRKSRNISVSPNTDR